MYVNWDLKVGRHVFVGLVDIEFLNCVFSSAITEDEDSANIYILLIKVVFFTTIEDRQMNLFDMILLTYAQSHIL